MKEAPERVYIQPNAHDGWFEINPNSDMFAEYVRKDAFVDKALKFLDENFFFNNGRYSIESGVFDSKEEMYKDFKKYMED